MTLLNSTMALVMFSSPKHVSKNSSCETTPSPLRSILCQVEKMQIQQKCHHFHTTPVVMDRSEISIESKLMFAIRSKLVQAQLSTQEN